MIRTLLSCIATLLISVGCVVTKLPPSEIQPEAFRLAQLGEREIEIVLAPHIAQETEETLGRQYLLFVIPFGRIAMENPSEHLYNSLYKALATKGIKVVPQAKNKLSVNKAIISLTAYDFFFIRRVVCKVTIVLDGRTVGSAKETLIHPAPFQKVLARILTKTINKAVDEAIDERYGDIRLVK